MDVEEEVEEGVVEEAEVRKQQAWPSIASILDLEGNEERVEGRKALMRKL